VHGVYHVFVQVMPSALPHNDVIISLSSSPRVRAVQREGKGRGRRRLVLPRAASSAARPPLAWRLLAIPPPPHIVVPVEFTRRRPRLANREVPPRRYHFTSRDLVGWERLGVDPTHNVSSCSGGARRGRGSHSTVLCPEPIEILRINENGARFTVWWPHRPRAGGATTAPDGTPTLVFCR
jgi:hypothetical protein